VVAGINVMATYIITLILIPIILSFLPPPTSKQMRHLEGKRINKILAFFLKLKVCEHNEHWYLLLLCLCFQ